jgi:hypothetical protein
MKNRATIRMGASLWTVTVRGADGKPVEFDLYRMEKKARADFTRKFVKAFRDATA